MSGIPGFIFHGAAFALGDTYFYSYFIHVALTNSIDVINLRVRGVGPESDIVRFRPIA